MLLRFLKNDVSTEAKSSYDQSSFIYAGGLINTLNWIDPKNGIYDSTYLGLTYVSGTCIIFSRDLVYMILTHQHQLIYDVIDDVAFGLFIHIYIQHVKLLSISGFMFVQGDYDTQRDIEDIIFYRNNNENRTLDCLNMKYIVSALINQVT